MPVEPLASVAVFAGLVCVLCALLFLLGHARGYDRGHARASAADTAWRAELAAQVKAAKASYASPPPACGRTS